MVSINTALSVDLTGQVCSEAFGHQQYTGTGGPIGHAPWCNNVRRWKAIIAMRSSVKNDTISTIVPTLAQGSFVTIPRHDVDYIITEYGVAHLRGRSLKRKNIGNDPHSASELSRLPETEAEKLGFI